MDRGFSLIENDMSVAGDVIWSFAFDKLRSSSDDGIRTLFLDFGPDDGEFVSNFLPLKELLPTSNVS